MEGRAGEPRAKYVHSTEKGLFDLPTVLNNVETWANVPLIVNLQPAGEYLGEDYHHAGGVPAVVGELIKAGKINKDAMTVNGKTLYENCRRAKVMDRDVIWPYKKPMKKQSH